MLLFKKVVLSDTEKSLLFKDRQFVRVLDTGKYRFMNVENKHTFRTFELSSANQLEYDQDIIALADKYPEKFSGHLSVVNTGQDDMLLVWRENRLVDMLPPASEAFVWETNQALRLEKVDIHSGERVPPTLMRLFNNQKGRQLSNTIGKLTISQLVPDRHVGFLFKDGQFVETLSAGQYMWWTTHTSIGVKLIDMRLQSVDVSGQEILTKDRVSIRLNLLANWRTVEPEKLVLTVYDPDDFLYRELQLALRTVVATKTLDELLADKNLLNDEIKGLVEQAIDEYGIELKSVGVKDVILPGEMKTILAQVVEAQKAAEANVIKRREETQATRSLHNTAKVMENNPVLLRLKELETLEKITAKIATLNVYGGLNGVMHDLVSLTDKSDDKTPIKSP